MKYPLRSTVLVGCAVGVAATLVWADRWAAAQQPRLSGQWGMILPFALPIGALVGIATAVAARWLFAVVTADRKPPG